MIRYDRRKEIEAAAKHYAEVNMIRVEDQMGDLITDTEELSEAYKEGAHWAVNEFLKDLFHAACEVPWNDNGKVLSFSREIGYRKLYDMNAMLNETPCNTYKEMWEKEVKAYRWSDWIYVDELFGLIAKGGKHD